jgi:hypothetical protein
MPLCLDVLLLLARLQFFVLHLRGRCNAYRLVSCDILAIARDVSFIVPQPALCEIAEQPLADKATKNESFCQRRQR